MTEKFRVRRPTIGEVAGAPYARQNHESVAAERLDVVRQRLAFQSPLIRREVPLAVPSG